MYTNVKQSNPLPLIPPQVHRKPSLQPGQLFMIFCWNDRTFWQSFSINNFYFVNTCLVFAELLLLCAPAVLKVVKVLGCCTVLKSISKGDKDKDKDKEKDKDNNKTKTDTKTWTVRAPGSMGLVRQAVTCTDEADSSRSEQCCFKIS